MYDFQEELIDDGAGELQPGKHLVNLTKVYFQEFGEGLDKKQYCVLQYRSVDTEEGIRQFEYRHKLEKKETPSKEQFAANTLIHAIKYFVNAPSEEEALKLCKDALRNAAKSDTPKEATVENIASIIDSTKVARIKLCQTLNMAGDKVYINFDILNRPFVESPEMNTLTFNPDKDIKRPKETSSNSGESYHVKPSTQNTDVNPFSR